MSSACNSCGTRGCGNPAHVVTSSPDAKIIALAGNPNVGKTSVFNALTGMRQHTGNWPGKTVHHAEGAYVHGERKYTVIDLPGTYSLSSRSAEEEVARDFICFGEPDVTVVVADATALERNLNLALQAAEITPKVVVCVNLLDEARRKNILIDLDALAYELGVPVIGTVARTRRGITGLKDTIAKVALGELSPNPMPIVYDAEIERAAGELESKIAGMVGDKLSPRWVALRLLEDDPETIGKIHAYLSGENIGFSQPQLMEV